MAQQTINVGAAPNDGTGDPVRTAFTKSNDNFTELYSAVRAANQVFYCDPTDAADVATYKRLLLTPSTHAESTVAVSCTGTGDVLVGAFITDPGVPGAIEYPAGSAYRRLYGSVSAGVARFHLQVYTRTTGGVETLARDEFSNSFSNTSATLQEWLATPTSAGVLTATDRIVGKIYAQRVSGPTSITVTFYAEGSAHASQIQTTITTGSSASISASPPLALTGGNLTIDLSGPPQGRLTLQTITPVMTTSQAAKTTIYYTPYVGNQVPIYDGTNMVMMTFTELSNVTTASSVGNAGPAAVAASSLYDLFVWSNGGTVTFTRGPAWTNSSTRSAGTALVRVNGIWLNSASITNGPAAQRGTYVGTIFSDASSQLNFIYGALAAGGTAGHFDVWNTYNRVWFFSQCMDSADSWTVSTAWTPHSVTFRNYFTCGLAEDATEAAYHAIVIAGTPGFTSWGIGINSTTIYSGITGYAPASTTARGTASYGATVMGQYFMVGLENSGTGTTAHTYFGDAGVPAGMQTGLELRWRG